MKAKILAYPYIIWMILFTVVPAFLLLYYAFTDVEGVFTLANFIKFFTQFVYVKVLFRSLGMAFVCTIICFMVGYPVAYLLASNKRGGLLAVFFILPMWMNFLLRTYAWVTLLENTGIINSIIVNMGFEPLHMLYTQGAVMVGMIYNFLPFMILPIYTVLRKMDPYLLEAAQDLGASPLTAFKRITLPLSVPGIASGVTMVFMPAVTTFVLSRLLGGSQYMLFGDLIEQQFISSFDWNFGSALSIIMLVIILLSMAVMNKLGGSKAAERATLL